jgi:hypothetical protein
MGERSNQSRGFLRRHPDPVWQKDQAFLYAHHFPKSVNLNVNLGDSLGEEWSNVSWHLFVVNWKGSHVEVSWDGPKLKSGEPGCDVGSGAITERVIGGCAEPTLIDEFLVYRRPLTENDIRVLLRDLHKEPKSAK